MNKSNEKNLSKKTKVNILVIPTQEYWQAKVHQADTGSVVYESEKYSNKQSAEADARRWAHKKSLAIGKTAGM